MVRFQAPLWYPGRDTNFYKAEPKVTNSYICIRQVCFPKRGSMKTGGKKDGRKGEGVTAIDHLQELPGRFPCFPYRSESADWIPLLLSTKEDPGNPCSFWHCGKQWAQWLREYTVESNCLGSNPSSTTDKFLNISVPQFPYLLTQGWYLTWWMQEITELIHTEYLENNKNGKSLTNIEYPHLWRCKLLLLPLHLTRQINRRKTFLFLTRVLEEQ